jgi:hypothetical protein
METLEMSPVERKRLEVFSRVKLGQLRLGQASELLGVSYRQVKRIWRRYQEQGDGGLVHGLRGEAVESSVRHEAASEGFEALSGAVFGLRPDAGG